MQKRVFLHVGLPKSGTTFLQAALAANKKQLKLRAELLYPGRTWKNQVYAVRDLRQTPLRSKRQRAKVPGAWNRLAAEINAFPGNTVVSMEWLCRAQPDHVQRIIRDFDGAQIEVVFTVRDLGRTLPSSWQESIKNQYEWSWREFLEDTSGAGALWWRSRAPGKPAPAGEDQRERRFWRLHDTVALLARWTPFLPPEQVHVITVPKAGAPPGILWERFAGVLGIDASAYVAEGLATNESLGLESTEVLRMLNPRTRENRMPIDTHRKFITAQLGKRGLSQRRHREPRLTLPGDAHDWVRARAEHEIDGITAAGVNVVGDLDELRPDLSGPIGPQPEELDTDALLDTALDALVIAVQQRAAESKSQARDRKRLLRREARARRRVEARTARRSGPVRAVADRLRGGKRGSHGARADG